MMLPDGGAALAHWISEIPADWRCTRIDNLAEVLFSNVDKHSFDHENPVQLCNYVDVYKNDRITRKVSFMEATAEPSEIDRFQVRRGDVLATKDSETPGDIAVAALVDDDLPGVLCGYHLAMLRPRSRQLRGSYLAWLHASKAFRAQYEGRAVGVTRFGLPQYAFRAALIPLPRSEEQQLIVRYLNLACAAIDAASVQKRQQLDLLARLRITEIQRAVTVGLRNEALRPTQTVWMPQLPTSWCLASLKRVATIQTGLTLGKNYDGPLVERPYLRVANVQDGKLALEDVTLIEVPESVARGITLRSGDVLMTEGGDLDKLGRGTVWNDEIPNCMHQNHVFAIRCFRHKLLPQFLAYLTASPYGRGYFEATGKKTTNLASTNATKVGLFPIPLPTVGEQAAICEYLDGKLSDLARLASTIEAQIDTLTAYRKSLIHECVTGQRRITDADLNRLKAHAPATA